LFSEHPTLYQITAYYYHSFTFYDSEAKIELSNLVEINTIELDKLPKVADGSQLYDWAKFIDAKTEEELSMIAERNPQVKEVVVADKDAEITRLRKLLGTK
jgi:hypothetical protein